MDLEPARLLLHLVDLVLLVSLSELLWLAWRRPAGLPHLLPNLAAGLSLALALRLGLAGAGLPWVAPCLLAAGVAHWLDLRARRRMMVTPNPPPITGPERTVP